MLKVKRFNIDFGIEEIILNEKDAKELGINRGERVKISFRGRECVAVVSVSPTFIGKGNIGVFNRIAEELNLKDKDVVKVAPVLPPGSVLLIKKKLKGVNLTKEEIEKIVKNIVDKSLSLIDLAAFVCALEVRGMSNDEVTYLTRAMAETGKMINFGENVFDKHSLGGVPGDKTTLIVVPIVASCGLLIPKTSSRSITDPAGTADRMEIFAPVEHSLEKIIEIVNKTNACIVWGGAVDLSPADDALIQVENPLSLDPRPLLLASVMSKKYAIGSKFVVIDIPVGEGTKVATIKEGEALAKDFIELGKRLGMKVECAITYGAQPVGNAMGPVLEAIEAIETLQGNGPKSLIEKACAIAGILLEAGGVAKNGEEKAKKILKEGKALKKFKEIIKVQGGNENISLKELNEKVGKYSVSIKSERDGYVTKIKNREIARVARYAGAPNDKGAGVLLHAKGGDAVSKGQSLFTIFAEKEYKLKFAKSLALSLKPVTVESMLLEEIPGSFLGRH